MSALSSPSPSTAALIALESAFVTPARNLTKSRGKTYTVTSVLRWEKELQ